MGFRLITLNKYLTKTTSSDQTGKGETGWGIIVQEVLVAERLKQSDWYHSVVIYRVYRQGMDST